MNTRAKDTFKYEDSARPPHRVCVILLPGGRRGSQPTRLFIQTVSFCLNKKTFNWIPCATFSCSQELDWPLEGTSSCDAHPHRPWLCICNKHIVTFRDKTALLLSAVNLLKTHKSILVCITCMKNISAWQAPLGNGKEVLRKETAVANSEQYTGR